MKTFLFLLGAILALPTYAADAAASYLDFRTGGPVPLTVEGDGTLTTVIPVWSTGGRSLAPGARLPLPVMDVSFKGVLDSTLRPGTTVELLGPDAWHGPAVAVKIAAPQRTPLLATGEYAVRFAIPDWSAAPPAAGAQPPQQQLQELRFTRAAAKIDAPGSYVATLVRNLTGPDDAVFPDLLVRENGGQSSICRLSLRDVTMPSDASKLSSGRIADATIANVQPSSTTALKPAATGEFRLGDNEGKLELSAPELSAPTQVSYKVKVRRSFAFLILCATVGMLAGLLIRGFLAHREALNKAREQALDVLASIDDFMGQFEDQAFRVALAARRKELEETVDAEKPEAMVEKAKAVNDAVASLVAQVRADCATQARSLEALTPIVPNPWPFRPPLAALIQRMADDAKELPTRLAKGDAGGVKTKLTVLVSAHAPALQAAHDEWRANLKRVLDLIVADPTALSKAVQDDIRTSRSDWPSSPATIFAGSNLTEIGAWLVAVNREGDAVNAYTRAYADRIRDAFRPVVDALKKEPKAAQAAADLEEASDELAAAIRGANEEPRGAYDRISATSGRIGAAFAALSAQLTSEEDRGQLDTLVKNKDYLGAAEKAIASLRGEQCALGSFPKSPTPDATAGQARGFATIDVEPTARIGAVALAQPAVWAMRRVQQLRFQCWWIRLGIAAVNTLAAGAIYLATLYLTSAERFVGTYDELLLIALTAFAWDFTLGNAVTKIGQLKK